MGTTGGTLAADLGSVYAGASLPIRGFTALSVGWGGRYFARDTHYGLPPIRLNGHIGVHSCTRRNTSMTIFLAASDKTGQPVTISVR